MSTLMFWNKQNANNNQNNEAKNGKKNWLHAPDALVNGHVAYLVKFLGSTPVDQAKGIDTVKDAIRKLHFAQQMKKSDSGNNVKSKKVEITISVDGLAVQEPRSQKILHQFPLHNISYCADEKGAKKFFSFIAKTGNVISNGVSTTNHAEESHECFVFISSKLASDITLTIGQAFELAYRRYMTDGGKVTEISKLQSQNKQLENTVSAYKERLKDFVELLPKSDVDKLLLKYGVKDVLEVPNENGVHNHVATMNGNKTTDSDLPNNDDQLLIETPSSKHFVPTVPPRNLQNQINNTLDALKPSVGTKLEGLLLNSDSDSDFDPRADECETTMNGNKISNDFFGFEPPTKSITGQQIFPTTNQMSNGINGLTGSSPPLLAPPPKAAIPRRNGPINNNINQDLFGSTPFSASAQQSPFDESIGSDTFNNSSVSECMLDSSTISNVHRGDDFKNPFNKSDISNNYKEFEVDYLHKNYALHDISTLTNNSEKLDGILKTKLNNNLKMDEVKVNPFIGTAASSTHPPLSELKGIDLPKANPFSSIIDKNQFNYDALKNTFDTVNIQTQSAVVVDVNEDKIEIDNDLFKDAAAVAFNEFNKNKHEFSNKLVDTKVPFAIKNYNYGNGEGKNTFSKDVMSFSTDDFTLESLDPLRK